MSKVILVAGQPWDFAVLAPGFSGANQVNAGTTRLDVAGVDGHFSIDAGQGDGLLGELSNSALVEIGRAMTQAHAAQLDYENPAVANRAIRALPAVPDIFIDNGMGVLMTVAEAQRRLDVGIEWLSRALAFGAVDLLAKPNGELGHVELVIVEHYDVVSQRGRDDKLRSKLAMCVLYALYRSREDGISHDRPDLFGRAFSVVVVHTHPLTEAMRQMTQASDGEEPPHILPLSFATPDEFRARYGLAPLDLPSLRRAKQEMGRQRLYTDLEA